jgi:hypothetical protein
VIALASILYGSVMAFTQTNVRLIGGYSSVAQLGFITAGIFALRADGADGAILQMVNHGLVVAPLFIIVAILAERSGSEDLREMGGMAMRAPVLAALFLIVTLATLAMPGSANFVRRVLHPQRASSKRRSSSPSSPSPASRCRLTTRCASTSGRCTTAGPRGSSRARSASATASSWRRWCLHSGLALLNPQFCPSTARPDRHPHGGAVTTAARRRGTRVKVPTCSTSRSTAKGSDDLPRTPHRLRGALARPRA